MVRSKSRNNKNDNYTQTTKNGIAERTNHTLVTQVLSTLTTMSVLFDTYWALCLPETTCKTKITLQATIKSIPRQLWERKYTNSVRS